LLKGFSFIEIIMALLGVIVGSTYIVTYIYVLTKTWREKKLSIE